MCLLEEGHDYSYANIPVGKQVTIVDSIGKLCSEVVTNRYLHRLYNQLGQSY